MKFCFVDVLGLSYDGSTLDKRGLGGSESALISMAKELSILGFQVDVFNDCTSDDNHPGLYDGGVTYRPLAEAEFAGHYDVVVGSRSVAVFTPYDKKNNFKSSDSSTNLPNFDFLVNSSKHKVLWLHDTFCDGDDQIETLIQAGRIDEIFTLSDWHTAYITNCDHGRRRNFDFLKRHIFQTRNGINKHLDWVDVAKKDPDSFVFNASVTKGMIPLVHKVWPELKRRCPAAKLTIIGGYYKFREASGPDQQEQDWHQLVAECHQKPELGITFTGVIPQQQIALILAEASYTIYPCAFPETFGISTLESLAYNTPIITCNFGALEETAIDAASYKIDYPVEKNWSLQWLDEQDQINKFIDIAEAAYNNKYLHQQKMQACSAVHSVCTWDTVALQWMQHLYHKMDRILPVDTYRAAQKVNYDVQRIFGHRYSSPETLSPPKMLWEHEIQVIVPFFNAGEFIKQCILSIAQQDYNYYKVTLVDDASTDDSFDIAHKTINSLPPLVRDHFTLIKNQKNVGALANQMNNADPMSDIIMLLDGDDWLVADPNIFNKYNILYHTGAEFTYGSCWSRCDNIPLVAQEYPPEVKANKSYRDYKFAWGMPYTHLRTMTGALMQAAISKSDPKYKAGGDCELFYNAIELVDDLNTIIAVKDIVCVYNDAHALNDYKINGEEQTRNANEIMKKKIQKNTTEKKKVLLAIPTARYIESDTFKAIFDLDVPDDIELNFQYFYGYRVDQVRNLIADWTMKGKYDYLFAVDHDIILPKDALTKMLSYNVPLVSGVYRQRLPNQILEIYDLNYGHMDISHRNDLVQIGACGFGCVLIKGEVLEKVGYPQFEYHPALDHANTFSEDVDFCKKATAAGFALYADASIRCGHIGQHTFTVEDQSAPPAVVPRLDPVKENLRDLSNRDLLPVMHQEYLAKLREGTYPRVIYDIGSCVMHWTRHARKLWPVSEIICFEAMSEVKFLYDEVGIPLVFGNVLGDDDGIEVSFYQNAIHPGGNSLFKESRELSPRAEELFPDAARVIKPMRTLDSIVNEYSLPLPDMIKLDVQGSEMAVLKGAEKTLLKVKDIIIELQHQEYNIGSPSKEEVIDYLDSIGFKLQSLVDDSGSLRVDADYHFVRK